MCVVPPPRSANILFPFVSLLFRASTRLSGYCPVCLCASVSLLCLSVFFSAPCRQIRGNHFDWRHTAMRPKKLESSLCILIDLQNLWKTRNKWKWGGVLGDSDRLQIELILSLAIKEAESETVSSSWPHQSLGFCFRELLPQSVAVQIAPGYQRDVKSMWPCFCHHQDL